MGVGSNGGPEPTTDALPPTLSADLQQPAPTADSTAPTAAPSGAASGASATDPAAPPSPETSGPARPGASTSGEPPAGPAPGPLEADVPEGFALGTGGPPADLPVVVHNTGSTPLPPPTLVLSLPDGVRVVGPGEGLLGRPLVALDGAEAQTTVPCPAGSGTVTCTARQELAPGESVRFVFRLLAGPTAVSGTVTGTVGSAPLPPVRVEFPVAVTPKK
ncbi:hypothetical protein K7G98_17700 [Saccharothrix sp. MB29]|nr:hypothetical protein [Saccharothrix sp. MB29]